MTEPTNDPDRDDALDERSRAALRRDSSLPPPSVRKAILDNARARADERRVPPPRAANDARWQIPAAAAIVAAIALVVAQPIVEQPVPPPAPSASPRVEQAMAKAPGAPAVELETQLVREQPAPHDGVSEPFIANRSLTSAMADANTGSRRVRAGMVEPASAPAAPEPTQPAAGAVAAFAERPRVARAEIAVDAATDTAVAARESGPLARAKVPAANVNAFDAQGRTALMRAAQISDPALVRSLLAQGADPNVADAHGATPLGVARRQHMTEIEHILEAAGGR